MEVENSLIGDTLKKFKLQVDVPLSAILSLNTIAHTVGAIGVGEEATKIWSDTNPWITGVGVPVFMTGSILFLSEVIPKTIGAVHWKVLVPFTISSMRVIVFLMMPLIAICRLVTKVFTIKEGQKTFSRSDYFAMAQIGSKEGVLDSVETNLVYNVLEFKKLKVREVMTPRSVVCSVQEDSSVADFLQLKGIEPFSRIPVRRDESIDTIDGYVLKQELFGRYFHAEAEHSIKEYKRKIKIVPESKGAFYLFYEFIQESEHMALVVDEYGGVAGIVTMEDILETLIGQEIVDETDKVIDMQLFAKKRLKNF